MTVVIDPGLQIDQPGIYPDVSERDYHADPVAGGSLTSSGARTLTHKTPAHFAYDREHGRPDKTDFDVGHAAHHYLLGGGADVVEVPYDSWSTKEAKRLRSEARAAGLTPLLSHQLEAVRTMVAAVLAHPVAGPLFRRPGRSELTVVGRDPETGVMCRARFDRLVETEPGGPLIFVDLKTCDDASQTGLAKSMSSWGYHQQLPWYEDVLRWALGLPPQTEIYSVLVGVEKPAPHLVGFGEPDEQAVAWGRVLNRKARGTFARCSRADDWPGHPYEPIPTLSLPGWLLWQLEGAEALGAYDIDGDLADDADREDTA